MTMTYRLYLLDARGRITWGEWFEAEGPAQALEIARERCKGGVPGGEVWQGHTRLASFRCGEQEVERGGELAR